MSVNPRLAELYKELELTEGYTDLYPHQWEAVEWAKTRSEPYLFINAPTGSGKTLLLTTLGQESEAVWTYVVHTIMLQRQVATTFKDIPVFMGRGNFDCLIGDLTHPFASKVTAAEAICAMPDYDAGDCEHDPSELATGHLCGYFEQAVRAMSSSARVVNYSMLLSYPPLVTRSRNRNHRVTDLLLCDEAHNVEEAVCSSTSLTLAQRTLQRMGIKLPKYRDILDWAGWANRVSDTVVSQSKVPDLGFRNLVRTVRALQVITPETAGEWLIEEVPGGIAFSPVWGAPFVMERLLGHKEAPDSGNLIEALRGPAVGVKRAVFTSATLMGAEYIAETLGLPDGSWAYLDMPSVFPPASRPINYAPVETMNASKIATPEGRAKMQDAVDDLIEFYVRAGRPWGIIHAVSNKYRDFLLTESRWRGIMVSTPDDHAKNVEKGEASVLVAANLTEGWDGRDNLCRFVIMPKVPFPNLGDKRTKIRMEEDPRSFDHRALVAVVQGAGRGVRHTEDYADTWILDGAWNMLYKKRKSWLPQSFTDAYHHSVERPTI